MFSLKKKIAYVLVFSMIFSSISSSLLAFAEERVVSNVAIQHNITESTFISPRDDSSYDDIKIEAFEFPLPVEEGLANEREGKIWPLLAGIVIRAIVAQIVRLSIKQSIKLSKHAVQRMKDRNISGDVLDAVISNGTDFIDGVGDRVKYDYGRKVAVIFAKDSDLVQTIMDDVDVNKKIRNNGWKRSKWNWVNDFK